MKRYVKEWRGIFIFILKELTSESAAPFQFQLFVSLSNLQFDSFVLLFKFSVPGCCFYFLKKA